MAVADIVAIISLILSLPQKVTAVLISKSSFANLILMQKQVLVVGIDSICQMYSSPIVRVNRK